MKKTTLILLALAFVTLGSYGQDIAPREKMEQVTMMGTVTDLNAETREITLMNTEGGLVTLTAGDEVERFDEIAIDDVIELDYYVYLKAEFRAPTEEEIAEPLQVVAEAGKAPKDMDPAGVIGAVVKAVVTIEVLNRPSMLATVSGPNGNYVTIPMEDAELMTELRIGQVLILTYGEAMAISLEKVAVED